MKPAIKIIIVVAVKTFRRSLGFAPAQTRAKRQRPLDTSLPKPTASPCQRKYFLTLSALSRGSPNSKFIAL